MKSKKYINLVKTKYNYLHFRQILSMSQMPLEYPQRSFLLCDYPNL